MILVSIFMHMIRNLHGTIIMLVIQSNSSNLNSKKDIPSISDILRSSSILMCSFFVFALANKTKLCTIVIFDAYVTGTVKNPEF